MSYPRSKKNTPQGPKTRQTSSIKGRSPWRGFWKSVTQNAQLQDDGPREGLPGQWVVQKCFETVPGVSSLLLHTPKCDSSRIDRQQLLQRLHKESPKAYLYSIGLRLGPSTARLGFRTSSRLCADLRRRPPFEMETCHEPRAKGWIRRNPYRD